MAGQTLRDRVAAVLMVVTIAALAIFVDASDAAVSDAERLLLRSDIAGAVWQWEGPNSTTVLDVAATSGWQQGNPGERMPVQHVVALWARNGTDPVTGARTETSWEIVGPLDQGLAFDRSMGGAVLDLETTAAGAHCTYDEQGGGDCEDLGTARVHLNLRWLSVGEVTRDGDHFNELVGGVRFHQQARLTSREATITGSITGDVDLLTQSSDGLVRAAVMRSSLASRIFRQYTPTPPDAELGGHRLVTHVSQAPGSPYGSSAKVIALTFDDGPHPTWTRRVMSVLEDHKVKGTFLAIGQEAKGFPKLTRAIVRRGHVLAGHTMNHRNLRGLSSSAFSYQVDSGNHVLERLTGRRVRCVRPPFGAYDSTVVQRLSSRRLGTLMWSIDPKDWARPGADAIVSRTLSQLQRGGIAVLHDGGGDRSQTVAALPRIIKGARARGYRFVTVC